MSKLVKQMTAAQAIVECIKRENIGKVFCVPGESYLPILDALHDETEIEVISNRHEGGASFMAEGYAKQSQKPGIVLATRGPGAANLTIGVHTAYQDSTPMVVLLGQVHSKFRGKEGFQEVDFEQFFAPISKWAVEVTHAERMPEMMSRALRIAQSGRPGPVVISLPEDVLFVEAEMEFNPVITRPKPAPSQDEVLQVEAMLKAAKKPVIIAGGGIKSAGAEKALIKFAEKYKIPVVAAFRRQDSFPNNHPLYIGHLGFSGGNLKDVINEADVLLAFGTRLSEVTTQDYTLIKQDHQLIHVDIDYSTIGKSYAPEIGIISDMAEALRAFMSIKLETITWKKWAEQANNLYVKSAQLNITETDVINKQVIKILKEKLPKDTVITNDAGNFASWLHAFYSFDEPQTYVGPTSGAMGYGMPAAVGAKLAAPDKHVVSLSGDGGFMMTAQELETAVRYNIPIIALVFNNKMYGTIRMHQEIFYPERVVGTDLGFVSFSEMAKSLGAEGFTVETIQDFEKAFDQALKNDRVTVIEILTGKEQISPNETITQIRERTKKKFL